MQWDHQEPCDKVGSLIPKPDELLGDNYFHKKASSKVLYTVLNTSFKYMLGTRATFTQLPFTCSKLAIETIKQVIKFVQS